MQVLKVFAQGNDQSSLSEYGRVLAVYDAFAIVEPKRGRKRALATRFPTQDISAQYELPFRVRRIGATGTRGRGAVAAGVTPSRGRHHYLVQFAGPVKKQWLSATKRQGAELRELYQDFVYVVRADLETARAIAGLPCVLWVAHLPHEQRLAPSLKGKTQPRVPRTRIRVGVYTVQVFDSKLTSSVAAAARRLGFQVLSKPAGGKTLVVRAQATLARRTKLVRTLATIHGVRFIRARPIRRTSNDVAIRLMGVANSALHSRFKGQGEIIAICDTGLDTGDADDIHPDFRGRVVAIKSYPVSDEFSGDVSNVGEDDGPADLDSGHGTHVAGSALGSGAETPAGLRRPIRGLAPRARLVFQAVEQEMKWYRHVPRQDRDRYVLAGLPANLQPLFAYAYRKGARIHSNSWGGGEPGDYDEQCEQIDRFVCQRPDFTVLVAAGNDGSDVDGNGRINLCSVTPPATAKNAITVGASESLRRELGATYGGWWPDDYPREPHRNDPMADDPGTVAAFSSRGPTRDGRIKPDLVAPGTFILSTRSRMIAENNTGWQAFPKSHEYFFMGGTSMATPLVAGAAALVREYLRRKAKLSRPSAAVVKAVLIASAERLPSKASKGALADNHQGYGRVHLSPVLGGEIWCLDRTRGLHTGQRFSRDVTVRRGAKRLRVVLVYSDFPGPSLVNDLNLILTAPSGRKHTSAGIAKNRVIVLDSTNNVELIEIPAPRSGVWTLDVVGSNVPQGPQRFALALLGGRPRP